jgi:hypothetical protein
MYIPFFLLPLVHIQQTPFVWGQDYTASSFLLGCCSTAPALCTWFTEYVLSLNELSGKFRTTGSFKYGDL